MVLHFILLFVKPYGAQFEFKYLPSFPHPKIGGGT
jgi:hypothetical protein